MAAAVVDSSRRKMFGNYREEQMATWDYEFTKYAHHFSQKGPGREARLIVLKMLTLHINRRNRAWPSPETLAKETGYGRARVIEALQWLVEKGAIYNVPVSHRVGEEARLHGNKAVWQITGMMRVGMTFSRTCI